MIRLRSDMGVKLVQNCGSDSSITAAAKVSTEGVESQKYLESESKIGLIRYLMKQKHGTPFECASMTFLIEAPIFVFREFHRHRIGWSYSEASARYRDMEPVFWVPSLERKLLPVEGFKSSRPQFREGTDTDHERVQGCMSESYKVSWDQYQRMLREGYAREVCRSVLPVGIYSAMYATCNPRSLMHFLGLRTTDARANHPSFPQAEIEEVARKMEACFEELFPVVHQAFCEYGREAP